jgi:hypothetical protein
MLPDPTSQYTELDPMCMTGLLLTFEWLVIQEKIRALFADDPLVISAPPASWTIPLVLLCAGTPMLFCERSIGQ